VAVLGAWADHDQRPATCVIACARGVDVDLRVVCATDAVEKGCHGAHRALSLFPRNLSCRPSRHMSRARVSPAASDCLSRKVRPKLPRPRRLHDAGPHGEPMRLTHHRTARRRCTWRVVSGGAVVRRVVHGGVFGACSGGAAEFVRSMFAQTNPFRKGSWMMIAKVGCCSELRRARLEGDAFRLPRVRSLLHRVLACSDALLRAV
jgi:hypothetical protein